MFFSILPVNVFLVSYEHLNTSITNTEHEVHESEMWFAEVNRGGLVPVDDSLYQLLVCVEVEFRKYFTTENATLKQNMKDLSYQGIIESEDVQFHWSLVSSNWSKEGSDELLKLIVNHYTTVRGFSFTSAFVEKFKHSPTKKRHKKLKDCVKLCKLHVLNLHNFFLPMTMIINMTNDND